VSADIEANKPKIAAAQAQVRVSPDTTSQYG